MGCVSNRQVQNPMTRVVATHVITAAARDPRLRTYSTKCARPNNTTVSPTRIGDNHPATVAAVPPANPSRERTRAAVQLGTAAAAPNRAPSELATLVFVFTGPFNSMIPSQFENL